MSDHAGSASAFSNAQPISSDEATADSNVWDACNDEPLDLAAFKAEPEVLGISNPFEANAETAAHDLEMAPELETSTEIEIEAERPANDLRAEAETPSSLYRLLASDTVPAEEEISAGAAIPGSQKIFGEGKSFEDFMRRRGGTVEEFTAKILSHSGFGSDSLSDSAEFTAKATYRHPVTRFVERMEEEQRPNEEILGALADRSNNIALEDDYVEATYAASDIEQAPAETSKDGLINDLVRGLLLPRVSIPLSDAGDLDDVNLHIQHGKATLVHSDAGFQVQLSMGHALQLQREVETELSSKEKRLAEISREVALIDQEMANLKEWGANLQALYE